MKKRLLALLLTVVLLVSLVPVTALAEVTSLDTPVLRGTSGVHTNPLYPATVVPDSLKSHDSPLSPAATSGSHYGTVQEVAEDIRGFMTDRAESFTVYLHQPVSAGEDAIEEINLSSEIAFDLALEHTGVPVEGDYLKWHWYFWQTNWNASTAQDGYNVAITYDLVYYTTARQEQELDAAVDALLEELNLEGESDYRKVRAIYDYLCENVTYDYDNLNDETYTLKFTAYAALMDGTAVCQGYANLFYRLALTLGVDARLIAGDGGGPHAWNIVRLNDQYYNLDSTWDAGMEEYSYFLLNQDNFTGHTRYEEYDTAEFHAAYPMSPTDFDPESDSPHSHTYTTIVTDPTCTEDGFTTYRCACGEAYTDHIVPALGHDPVTDPALAPTCTETGLTEGSHCARCGMVLTEQQVVAATGHRWDEGVVTVEPTETESGLRLFTCLVCGQTDTKIIPSLNHEHSYEAVVVPPTCTGEGYTLHTCTGCDDSYTDSVVPPLGHSELTDSALAPTCTETGLTEGSHCSVCGLILIPQEPIPATGHHLGEWYLVSEPTGETYGLEVRYCVCGEGEERLIPKLNNPFSDVKKSDYFFEPVLWAVYKGITTGMSPTSFGPGNSCTRAQVVTFLYRAAGEPKPSTEANPFSDVKRSDYFYNAVLWAVEEGITTGMSPTSFGPNSPCTRAQVVTFLHRAAGTPAPSEQTNPFSDVKRSDYFSNAVLWAVENGITTGTGNGRFSPSQTCTRAQVVTFLYRANH